MPRHLTPEPFLQITILLPISFPPFFPAPHPMPLPRLKLPSKHRRCQVSSCLSLPPSHGPQPSTPNWGCSPYSRHSYHCAEELAGSAREEQPCPQTAKVLMKQTVAVPPATTGEQLPHCPAASQQAQSNATQNSAAGRAGQNPSL